RRSVPEVSIRRSAYSTNGHTVHRLPFTVAIRRMVSIRRSAYSTNGTVPTRRSAYSTNGRTVHRSPFTVYRSP
ncbi:MAG TPA: hypothetical protein PKL67_03970, partial [Anaerolineae bacterium]|nr:hypothetical protein [Anaerolineae bacterium]